MNLTELAISKNRVTYVLMAIILLIGIQSYFTLPRDSMPPYTVRVANVITAFPGASPDRIESLITEKIEKVARELPELDYVSSESRTGLSIITVALKDDVAPENIQDVWDRLRLKIDKVRPELPSGVAEGPDLEDEDVGVVYGISVGLISDGFSYAELEDLAEDVRDEVIKLDDAAKVELGGVIDERIFIDFDDAKLAKYGISSNQLKGIISSTNIIIPAGEINLGDERVILEPSGNFSNVGEIEKMVIPVDNGSKQVFLGDITHVYESYISPKKSIVKINGESAIAIYISLKEGANITQLGKQVDDFILSYTDRLPVGIDLVRVASQDVEVEKSIGDFMSNVYQSIAIVMIVMFVFLGLRIGVVVASLIPAAIILGILLMNVFGVGLNQVSLAGLIMALGMLVDNAIVMTESMMVKIEKGSTKMKAAIDSCNELIVPLLTSSLTTSAAFLSFYLAESVMGDIMGPLFEVITLVLLSSWLMALTIVPMIAIVLLEVKKKKKEKADIFDKLLVLYKSILNWSLNHPFIVIFSVLLSLGVSLWGFTKVPVIFMPDSERNLVTVDLNFPLGTRIEVTENKVNQLEQFIKDSLYGRAEGVLDWSSFVGEGPNSYDLGYFPGEANSGYAHLLVNTTSGKDNQLVIDKLEEFCFNYLPDAKPSIKRLGSGGGAAVPIEIRLSGKDENKLNLISQDIKEHLINVDGTKNVDDDWGPKIKKIYVDIDPSKLSVSGLTNQDIAISANTVLSGFAVGEYRKDDKTIPIMMKKSGSEDINYSDLEGLNIYNQTTGQNIPLAQIAQIKTEWQYAKRLRRDLESTVTIESQLEVGYTANDILKETKKWLEEEQQGWPVGYTYEFGGDAEGSSDAMGAVADKFSISVFIIVLLLVLQFNSIRKSMIIMFTIPLGVVGVVGGLLLTDSFFSFTAFLGLISLAGIIINNAIVMIDRIQIEQTENGRNDFDAIKYAAFERFRPILLTTFTTAFGLIPLWIGGGDMWRPMAISIIFGLLFATIVTLLFVPILFKLLYRVKA